MLFALHFAHFPEKFLCLFGVLFGDFLPLKTYNHIVEDNALSMNWKTLIPSEENLYIMGNPPFLGYSVQTKEQKQDMQSVFADESGKPYSTAGKIDYVAGWYYKTSEIIVGTGIRTAFVSTNSITQGEQSNIYLQNVA